MERRLRALIARYARDAPLDRASTIPAAWYTDPAVFELEQQGVFGRSWQVAARLEQVRSPGRFVAGELAGGEPFVVVRGSDGVLRAFFNVCRHHAAAVVTAPEGTAEKLRCPYHGWTYTLEGALRGTPDFSGVCDFDRAANGLVPMAVTEWGPWVLVCALLPAEAGSHSASEAGSHPAGGAGSYSSSAGGFRLQPEGLEGWPDLARHPLERLQWVARRVYSLDCNWKVFVDNYLDGGYHVPSLHKALDASLDYGRYRIETAGRACLQSSPTSDGGQASYYWVYPNFMINVYDDRMDTNLVVPRGVDRTDVVFDFHFADVSSPARIAASIAASERIQDEDVAICASVQRGLRSRAYEAGRLSVRREAGEHLFHQLLADDLRAAIDGLTDPIPPA